MKESKPVILIGHLFFIAMFAFAAYFFVERMTYIDSSYYTFNILTFKSFSVALNRYTDVFTQIFPVLAMKLHLSLKALLISYSVSFVVIYYLIFLVNVYLFKSLKAGITTILVMILGISHAAFYPVTEIEFGVVLCTLFYAYVEFLFQRINSSSRVNLFLIYLAGIFIVLLCLFTHLATIIPLLFIFVFEVIEYKFYSKKSSWILFGLIITLYLVKLVTIKSGSYEGEKLEPLHNFGNLVMHFRDNPTLRFFIHYTRHGIYALPIILMMVTSLYYLLKARYVKLIYFGTAVVGCFVFLMVIHSPGESIVGTEKNILPFWVLAAVPFVHDILLNKKINHYFVILSLVIIIIAGFLNFGSAAKVFTARTEYLRQILKLASDKTGGSKFVMEYKSLNMDLIMNHWAIANETLLLSSLEGKNKSKTLYLVDDINKLKSEYDFQQKDVYLSVSFWLIWGYKDLNHDYFNLPEEPYIFVKDVISPK